MCRGYECARVSRPCENQIARFVADKERADDARRPADIDDTDTVGEVVDNPDLVVRARDDRDGFESHAYRGDLVYSLLRDVENFEVAVRRVDREQPGAVRGKRERPDLSALEQIVGFLSIRGARGHEQSGDDGKRA